MLRSWFAESQGCCDLATDLNGNYPPELRAEVAVGLVVTPALTERAC